MSEIDVLQNEFVFLSKQEIKGRKRVVKAESKVRESVTPSIRKMLMEIYGGKCQVTGFTFLTRENKPYFEIHHIDKEKGNHVKNLLVVSSNTHAQFEKCHIEQHFDDNGWLRSGKFNDETFTVFQAIDKLQQDFEKEIHFT